MLTQRRWERLFGRTDSFGIRVTLDADRDRPTWGTIALYANGVCLTRSQHGIIGMNDEVHWDLVDVFGWLADNLVSITTEGDFPARIQEASTAADWLAKSLDTNQLLTSFEEDEWFERRFRFWARHSLAAVGGLSLPDIVFRRVLNSLEISWTSQTGQCRKDIRWVESEGAVRLPAEEATNVLVEALRCSLEELTRESDARVDPSLLEKVRRLRDPSALANFRPQPFSLAASGRAIELNPGDLRALREVVRSAHRKGRRPSRQRLVPSPAPPPLTSPWSAGYELARDYRDKHVWASGPAPDMKQHLESLGVDVGPIRLSSPELHGLSLVGPECRPTTRWNEVSPRSDQSWSRQMILAHELCHLLYDWQPAEDFSILSSDAADWPTEARANAFAAELILPRDGIASILGGRELNLAVLREVMRYFGVGAQAATWHLKNLGVVTEDQRIALLLEHSRRSDT